VRARASERLLAAGEEALPALGAAEDLVVAGPGGQAVSATRPVVEGIVGTLPDARLRLHLESGSAALRRAAAAELGSRDRWDVVPPLIERLDDADAGVRAAAAASLRRLTNQFFGFEAEAGLLSRRIAAERWRDWWSVEGRARAADPRRGTTGG
jgi:HEAT repeat protein